MNFIKAKMATPQEKPCRVCTDFRDWTSVQKRQSSLPRTECPADREELGRATWTFLHTTAAYFPNNPTQKEQRTMKELMAHISTFYPCSDCADHMQASLKSHPPDTTSQAALSLWMCHLHNEVNERLGKPLFDCSRVQERWRQGWRDGSCNHK